MIGRIVENRVIVTAWFREVRAFLACDGVRVTTHTVG